MPAEGDHIASAEAVAERGLTLPRKELRRAAEAAAGRPLGTDDPLVLFTRVVVGAASARRRASDGRNLAAQA